MNGAKYNCKIWTQMWWSEQHRVAFKVLLFWEGIDKSSTLKSNNNIIKIYWHIFILLFIFSSKGIKNWMTT